jgi:hypothetical protein
MIIWWFFDEYFTYFISRKWTTHPLSPGYVAWIYRWPGLHAQKGGLRFVVFITARWPLCPLMPAMTIIWAQGCELTITVFAFETQESVGFLALRLTLLTAHWRPQHWQFILLSKIMMAHTPRQIEIVCFTSNNSRTRNCMAEFAAY